jgi:predicted DNA-binding transcriptional regulator AlpA
MHHPTERMIPASEVLSIVGIKSHTTLREMIRRDGFPKPYEITKGKRHWAMSEVQAWLQQRMNDQRLEY